MTKLNMPKTNFASLKETWVEWPLLLYFMMHFFPPLPSALPNLCLLLSVLGVGLRYRSQASLALARLNHPIVWCWLLLVAILGVSLFQVPDALQAESWHRFIKDFGKGSLFGVVLLLHVDSTDKAHRIILAGVLAPAGMLLDYIFSTWQITQSTGEFPVQRDYLYWLLLYFPLAVSAVFLFPKWRILAALVAVGIIALAVTTGFRGAMLSLLVMSLAFVRFPGAWRLFLGGLMISVVGVTWLLASHPEQGSYALKKLGQTDSSGRVANHWLPAWKLSLERPVFGHGFGHLVFGQKVSAGAVTHPEWRPKFLGPDWAPSSPHSITFEVLFAGGFPGLISLGLLYGVILWAAAKALRRRCVKLGREIDSTFMYVCFVSLLGSYFVFSQFEAPAWRSLPIMLALFAAGVRLLDAQSSESQGTA